MISNKKYAQQKAALTRAINSGDKDKVIAACKKAVEEWGDVWPDDWSRWQRALDDIQTTYRLEDFDVDA